eukprot:scaffold28142_cov19-Prasinocladus_malaysianus.AAC.1
MSVPMSACHQESSGLGTLRLDARKLVRVRLRYREVWQSIMGEVRYPYVRTNITPEAVEFSASIF